MLFLKYITELIADTPGIPDRPVYVAVRMTVNPIVDTAFGHVITKFDSERTVDGAIPELICHKTE